MSKRLTPDDDEWNGFYVERDEGGAIVALTRGDMGRLTEQLSVDDPDVVAFQNRPLPAPPDDALAAVKSDIEDLKARLAGLEAATEINR